MNIFFVAAVFVVVFIATSLLAVYAYGRFAKTARGKKSYAFETKDNKTKIDQKIFELAEAEKGLGLKKDALSLIISNLDAFTARAVSAANAGRSLDLMYYIWDDDLTGRLLFHQIVQAAERGVRVRLLLDDINSQGRDPAYVAFDQHPNIDVRMFNPSRARHGGLRRGIDMVLRALTVTRRMHNKAFIVDGRIAFVGGRNISDAYFDAGEGSNFRDLDLMLIGPSVKKVEAIFDDFWNSAVVLPIHALTIPGQRLGLDYWKNKLEEYCTSEKAKPYLDYIHKHTTFEHFIKFKKRLFLAENVEVLSDPPEKALRRKPNNWLMKVLSPLIYNAKKSIQITSPYFVPGSVGTQKLCKLVSRGVDVKILTNSLAATDVAAVHGGYMTYRKSLLKGGVKLFELKPDGGAHHLRLFSARRASLHTKAFFIDGETAFVGSFNFDPRSESLNTEMGIIFKCPQISTMMDFLFAEETTGEMSYQVHLDQQQELYWQFVDNKKSKKVVVEPESPISRRLFVNFIRWLPIKSQL